MKTIGLIGGTSWHSTIDYYKHINNLVQEKLGGVHSAKCFLISLDFEEIITAVNKNDFQTISAIMQNAAITIEKSGADCLLLCANTMHNFAIEVSQKISIPLIHIAEETAKNILGTKIRKVGLLGTKLTMEADFYKSILNKHGIEVLIPEARERAYLHRCILNELTQGKFTPEIKAEFLKIITQLEKAGAEGIVMGCTEIPLLINQSDCEIPLFDTTHIHSIAAVEFALS